MDKLTKFISYLNESAGRDIYVWGAQGNSIYVGDKGALTEAKIRDMETSSSYADQAIELYRKRKNTKGAKAFDCSGLGCYYMEQVGAVSKGFDDTANGLKGSCTKIEKSKLKRGCFVFKVNSSGKATHIGYVVDEMLNVIEAQGRRYGVVKRPLSEGGWNYYGIPKFFKSEIDNSNSGKWTVNRNLKLKIPYMSGDDVKGLQEALKAKGSKYAVDKITSQFGPQTRSKVIAYQKDFGLEPDGIAGKNTITKLGGVWNG